MLSVKITERISKEAIRSKVHQYSMGYFVRIVQPKSYKIKSRIRIEGALETLNGGVEGIVVDPDSLNPAFKK